MSGSETRQKSSTTTLRLTPEEAEAVRVAAAAAGLGPSSFARIAVLTAAGRKPKPAPVRHVVAKAIADQLGALGAIGNNVNQMTKTVNSGLVTDTSALADFREVIERTFAETLALRRAVRGEDP